ncbi:MAG TPA: glycosyltransferase family 39 protein [Humisphaera sp.]|nr:glycosyltransferase family 39 protein [Humisphaera sp.]
MPWSPAFNASPIQRHYRFLFLAVLGLAGLCRVWQYAADRSFWQDEALLVLNIRSKTAIELLGKLDNNQAAPPLFLLAERGLYRTLGGSELSLRLLSVVGGLLSVLLMAAVARQVIGRPWNLLAILLFGASETLIWHATEVKPYGTDVFAALLLIWLAVKCAAPDDAASSERSSLAGFFMLCGLAAALAWLSYPSIFIFGAASFALLPRLTRRGARGWIAFVGGNAVVGISFLIVLLVCVRRQQSSSLIVYWSEDFLDLRHPLGWPHWLLKQLLSLCDYPLRSAGPVTLAGMIVGIAALIGSRRWAILGILAGPILLTLLAAAAQRYPFDGARLTAFLMPGILLLAVIGFQWIAGNLVPRIPWAALVPPGFVAILALSWAVDHLIWPPSRGHLRPIAAYVRGHARPDDGIYALVENEWACYWPTNDPRVRPEMDAADQIPFQRFWVIWPFANQTGRHRADNLLHWLDEFADQRDKKTIDSGGAAFLYERRPGALPNDVMPDISTHHRTTKSMEAGDPSAGQGVHQ